MACVDSMPSCSLGLVGNGMAMNQDLNQFKGHLDPHKEDKTIHSGHFMVSNVHEDEESEVSESKGTIPMVENKKSPESIVMPKSGIDSSLAYLLQCLSIAYCQKLTSPKWNSFKGLRLTLKDKIRLNNIIWREWHLQFKLGRKPMVCQFAIPVHDDHNKSESCIMEGKYWKRRPKLIKAEYHCWRTYYKNQMIGAPTSTTTVISSSASKSVSSAAQRSRQELMLSNYLRMDTALHSMTSMIPSNTVLPLKASSCLVADVSDLIDEKADSMDFSDALFTNLNPPFMFPDSKEFLSLSNSDLRQPTLVSMQPNLDAMDTDDLFPDSLFNIADFHGVTPTFTKFMSSLQQPAFGLSSTSGISCPKVDNKSRSSGYSYDVAPTSIAQAAVESNLESLMQSRTANAQSGHLRNGTGSYPCQNSDAAVHDRRRGSFDQHIVGAVRPTGRLLSGMTDVADSSADQYYTQHVQFDSACAAGQLLHVAAIVDSGSDTSRTSSSRLVVQQQQQQSLASSSGYRRIQPYPSAVTQHDSVGQSQSIAAPQSTTLFTNMPAQQLQLVSIGDSQTLATVQPVQIITQHNYSAAAPGGAQVADRTGRTPILYHVDSLNEEATGESTLSELLSNDLSPLNTYESRGAPSTGYGSLSFVDEQQSQRQPSGDVSCRIPAAYLTKENDVSVRNRSLQSAGPKTGNETFLRGEVVAEVKRFAAPANVVDSNFEFLAAADQLRSPAVRSATETISMVASAGTACPSVLTGFTTMSPSNSLDGFAVNSQVGFGEKKTQHTLNEKIRRNQIKNHFDDLKTLVPSLAKSSKLRISKASLLQRVADQVKQSRERRQQMLAEVEQLRKNIKHLKDAIGQAQRELPDDGMEMSGRYETSRESGMSGCSRRRSFSDALQSENEQLTQVGQGPGGVRRYSAAAVRRRDSAGQPLNDGGHLVTFGADDRSVCSGSVSSSSSATSAVAPSSSAATARRRALNAFLLERAQQKWKFYLLSGFWMQLFERYSVCVQPADTFDALYKAVFDFVELHASLPKLRELATQFVLQLSKCTSLMKCPARLPQELHDLAVSQYDDRRRTIDSTASSDSNAIDAVHGDSVTQLAPAAPSNSNPELASFGQFLVHPKVEPAADWKPPAAPIHVSRNPTSRPVALRPRPSPAVNAAAPLTSTRPPPIQPPTQSATLLRQPQTIYFDQLSVVHVPPGAVLTAATNSTPQLDAAGFEFISAQPEYFEQAAPDGSGVLKHMVVQTAPSATGSGSQPPHPEAVRSAPQADTLLNSLLKGEGKRPAARSCVPSSLMQQAPPRLAAARTAALHPVAPRLPASHPPAAQMAAPQGANGHPAGSRPAAPVFAAAHSALGSRTHTHNVTFR